MNVGSSFIVIPLLRDDNDMHILSSANAMRGTNVPITHARKGRRSSISLLYSPYSPLRVVPWERIGPYPKWDEEKGDEMAGIIDGR